MTIGEKPEWFKSFCRSVASAESVSDGVPNTYRHSLRNSLLSI